MNREFSMSSSGTIPGETSSRTLGSVAFDVPLETGAGFVEFRQARAQHIKHEHAQRKLRWRKTAKDLKLGAKFKC